MSQPDHFFVKETVDPATGSLAVPIYQTSAYLMPEGERFRYSRESNPTVEELNRLIAQLENAESATCFSSGMGAISTTLLALSKPGTKILVHKDSFARSYRLVTEYLKSWGVEAIVPELGNESILELAGEADIVFIESVTNPILRVYDVAEIAKEVHAHGGLLVVDSTFATPINQKAIDLGADIVIQSLSKFISGHNDVIAGSSAGKKELIHKVDNFRRTLGTSLDPNSAFLVIRGMKTLESRMSIINTSAMKIAEALSESVKFSNVRYPGLKEHPDHHVARKALKGFGGVITFDVASLSKSALEVMRSLKVVAPANTLGGVNSTISHPSTMSHRSLTKSEKDALGIGELTFRLSVGLEPHEIILEDINGMV